jgi:hypothetical protein
MEKIVWKITEKTCLEVVDYVVESHVGHHKEEDWLQEYRDRMVEPPPCRLFVFSCFHIFV